MAIFIRAFLSKDREAIIKLTKRLSEFELPEWRKADQIDSTNIEMVKNAMEESDPDNVIFVAENEIEGQIVGYIRLQTQTDYFSREKYGYIANVAVDRSVEGQGIGRKLLEKAEIWAQEKGFNQLKLHVFEENQHAKQVYEKSGYQINIIDYIKVIKSDKKS